MAQPLDSSQLPAFSAPPHLVDDSRLLRGWFLEPAGMLLQLSRPTRGTTRMAQWMVGPAFDQLTQRFADQRSLRVILDMRQMTGRSATARALLLAHAPRAATRIGHVIMLPSRHMGGDYLRLLEITVQLVRAAGVNIEIEHSLERALCTHPFQLASARPPGEGAGAARAARTRGSAVAP